MGVSTPHEDQNSCRNSHDRQEVTTVRNRHSGKGEHARRDQPNTEGRAPPIASSVPNPFHFHHLSRVGILLGVARAYLTCMHPCKKKQGAFFARRGRAFISECVMGRAKANSSCLFAPARMNSKPSTRCPCRIADAKVNDPFLPLRPCSVNRQQPTVGDFHRMPRSCGRRVARPILRDSRSARCATRYLAIFEYSHCNPIDYCTQDVRFIGFASQVRDMQRRVFRVVENLTPQGISRGTPGPCFQ